MAINSRESLKDYCLRKLGFPVVHIEIDDDQIEDRIDDAIEFFHEFHYDGTERLFLKHSVTQEDIDNQYVPIPENIIGISRVIPFKYNTSGGNFLFNPQYTLVANELYNLNFTNILYYSQVQSYIEFLNYQLRPLDSLRFNRRAGRCFLDFQWSLLEPGDFLVFDCFSTLDPEEFSSIFNDRLLKDYTTALIKRQWGYNTKKFEGVQLIGGITISGQQIYTEAEEEIDAIEMKIRSAHELPPIGFLD